ncbi:hypothetical protein BAOM_p032 (plasmid) [Peribacillus asahii]|uniref:Uncharacterized protein n=1 Tax=Peribacillus asahii TaxID=228899 RepID=A0A3T0KZC1_9BACI|nr:hypothetical protein [Peribacillus asahii]AZV45685.1 hypothetical protein BAOM_p032 [Peribacillus asahii]
MFVITEDTKRILEEGDTAFIIESVGEWYDSKLRLLISCFHNGMSKEEIREACDSDSADYNIYWTSFEG